MTRKTRVLLVDDEERFVLNLSRILGQRGFDAVSALDGLEAVRTVKRSDPFDVVVLDVNMPGLDGIAALKEIKALAPETEVIMLTGHATLENGIQALRLGAYDYLMKPCDIDELIEKIHEAHRVEDIKRQPILWRRNHVREVLRNPLKKLYVDDPLSTAQALFDNDAVEMAGETLYVFDRRDRLRGYITRRDILEAAEAAHADRSVSWKDLGENPHLLPDRRLDEIMHPDPMAAGPEDILTDVSHFMIMNNLRSLPVVEDRAVIGIVRLRDIFEYIDYEIE